MSASNPSLTAQEQAQLDTANASGLKPVVFVHGLWLLASSWDRWRTMFEERGFTTVAPGWPDDPLTVEEGRSKPELFAGKSIGDINSHLTAFVGGLTTKPAIIGHSFGGLFTQKLAGQGLASVSVAIDPAPARGVLPLPFSALKSAFPVLKNPANRNKAIMLTEEQFRFGFANAVSEDEAKELYDTFPVPGAGKPLFQAASANINPKSEASADAKNPERGPMLIISGELDHTVPKSLAHGAYKRQVKNTSPTEFNEIAGRGHSLVIDSGWQEVAQVALDFIEKHGE